MKKVVAQGAWEYTLFDVDGRLILEVVCGTVALFDMTIELNAEERAAWEANGVAGVLPLVAKVRDDPERYRPRKVQLPE